MSQLQMLQASHHSDVPVRIETADLDALAGSPIALVLPLQVIRSWICWSKAWTAVLARHMDVYRPEAHYMRGPGPKCRAKFAQAHGEAH
jgi:hypothetical protein